MRTRTGSLIAALVLTFAVPALGQQENQAPSPSPTPQVAQSSAVEAAPSEVPAIGRIEFGFRGDSVTGDAARYNRFRDLRQGAFVDRFRLAKESESWVFLGEARNIGYRDQRFSGEFESVGKVKAKFTWDQIPLFISGDTRSLQSNLGGGVLDVDDAIQRGIENRTLALGDAVSRATAFDMRSRRDVAGWAESPPIER